MLEAVFLPVLMQLTSVPDEFYEPQLSDATLTALEENERDGAKATIRKLEVLADAGDLTAMEALGELHSGGLKGLPADPKLGCDYFEQVGDRRADSLHNLATCYWSGNGRAKDQAKARTLYIKAAAAGWRMSFCAYGNMLVRGEGGPVDAEEGLRLCRMAALRGDRDAQTDYGTYLLTGNGTERDPVTARFMLEQAADQGQANAAFLLGQIFSRGDGTPTDHKIAGEWFAKAFESGRGDAAYEAARSLSRLGYRRAEDGSMTVRADLLREARDWLVKAKQAAGKGSESYKTAVAFDEALAELIAAAKRSEAD